MTTTPADFLAITEVMAVTHLSRASIYRSIRAGSFPAPVKFGPGKALWIRAEVETWIAERIAERTGVAA